MYFSEIDKNITRYITQGIRKAFKLSDKHKSIQLAARVEKPKYNKDGKLSKKPSVYYRCNECKGLAKSTNINVDHIEPVIPLNKKLNEMTINEYTSRVLNLACQLLCKPCHKSKSKIENSQRKKK